MMDEYLDRIHKSLAHFEKEDYDRMLLIGSDNLINVRGDDLMRVRDYVYDVRYLLDLLTYEKRRTEYLTGKLNKLLERLNGPDIS